MFGFSSLFISRNLGAPRILSTNCCIFLKCYVSSSKKSVATYVLCRNLNTSAIIWRDFQNPGNKKIITEESVILTDTYGKDVGKLSLEQAKNKAKTAGFDLVKMREKKGATSAIYKFMKNAKYQTPKTAKNSKDKIKVKEIRLNGKIAPQDLLWKSKKLLEFLDRGLIVDVSIMHKNNEKVTADEKMKIASQLEEDAKEVGMLSGKPEVSNLIIKLRFTPIAKKE